jgi:acetyl-CoA carboxylase biotin carboxyl carrier protein
VTGTEPDAAHLIELIDRLERLLDRSALSELEVEAGGTTLILRKPPAAAAPTMPVRAVAGGPSACEPGAADAPAADVDTTASIGAHAVTAPLTGVFYASPSPGAAPYVREGAQVSVGQVIGLIEAMKLFNEIKSDVTGVVRRIAVDDGALVKAKQTLIEVEAA